MDKKAVLLRPVDTVATVVEDVIKGDVITYQLNEVMKDAGMFKYAFRVYPNNPDLPHRQDFAFMKWI